MWTGRLRSLRWNVIAPVAVLVAALAAVAWFDLARGSSAEPPPLLGEVGTPVRGTFVPPTATPVGARPTPKARPTVEGAPGSPAERDARRRADLLLLVAGLNQLKAKDGTYPSTDDKLQTLCNYKEFDKGCRLGEVMRSPLPQDPLGDPISNGYWYQSDGQSAKVYASLEEDIAAEQQCPTDNVDLQKKANLICITIP
ncbi:MAG TPA: type II secretion system protein GspG [Dehalococcoidia bacterium]|nr:type II secretion system protein GspG [Dehalococcoidia bacterium]